MGIMGAPMSSFSVDDPAKAFLNEPDYTAVSFWIISIAMIAATVFFYAEAATVDSHWKTSLHVGGLVTLVAGVHYMYMREYWVAVGKSPIVYRYIDWSITVPLQMIEFNLILKAAKQSFNNMRVIVSLGWAIYPAGYFLGQVNNSASAAQALNVTYNIADFVNKIAFVLACWACAKAEKEQLLH